MGGVVKEDEEEPANGRNRASEEQESEKVDTIDTLAPAVETGEVRHINDLPEELLLEILLCLQPTPLLEVCFMFRHFVQLLALTGALSITIHTNSCTTHFQFHSATVSQMYESYGAPSYKCNKQL